MSFSREAILSINGFNEDYVRPAIGEDVDIFWRLKAQGYVPISVRNRAIAYHLYHKENWTNQDINKGIMACSRGAGQVICLNGLNNHL
jgi:GT2 family glycosyltransferase